MGVVKEELLRGMRGRVTEEQYKSLKAAFLTMKEDYFLNILHEAFDTVIQKSIVRNTSTSASGNSDGLNGEEFVPNEQELKLCMHHCLAMRFCDADAINIEPFLNIPREKAVEQLVETVEQYVTVDQYRSFRAAFISMPDNVFSQMLTEVADALEKTNFSPKSAMEAIREYSVANGVTFENMASNAIPVEPLDREANEALWEDISRTMCSDRVCLKRSDDKAICALWQNSNKLFGGGIPSDLFFAEQVPLLDCEIVIDETEEPGGKVCTYRVVIFPDYADRIKEASGRTVTVGAVVFTQGYTLSAPIKVCEGIDTIIGGTSFGYHNMPEKALAWYQREWTASQLIQDVYGYLETWYGIQVALLHPTVKDVFRDPVTVPVTGKKKKKGSGRRVVRYIRQHVVNAGALAAAGGTGRNFERHTLAWYVIGHWRHYANGKRVFVKPYWKGAMREVKMSLEGRDREVIIPEKLD